MWTNISEGLFSIFFRFNLQFVTILILNYNVTAPVFIFHSATFSVRQFSFFSQGVNDNSACVFKVLPRGMSCE